MTILLHAVRDGNPRRGGYVQGEMRVVQRPPVCLEVSNVAVLGADGEKHVQAGGRGG